MTDDEKSLYDEAAEHWGVTRKEAKERVLRFIFEWAGLPPLKPIGVIEPPTEGSVFGDHVFSNTHGWVPR